MPNACRTYAERMTVIMWPQCVRHAFGMRSTYNRHAFFLRLPQNLFCSINHAIFQQRCKKFDFHAFGIRFSCNFHAFGMRSAYVSCMPTAWESHENRMNGWESHRNGTLTVSIHLSLPYPCTLHDTLSNTVLPIPFFGCLFPGSSIVKLTFVSNLEPVRQQTFRWVSAIQRIIVVHPVCCTNKQIRC
jgi:hypothetical protein